MIRLKRWLPLPMQSAVLFAVWLMLNNSIAPGHLLLAAFLAIFIPKLCHPLQSDQPLMQHPLLATRYFLVLLWDIMIANLRVAKLVLGSTRKLRPAFVAVPMDLREDLPLTLLASTITLTPGTLSAELSEDKRWLYIHTLDLDDEESLISEIKQRYERPLREIFRC